MNSPRSTFAETAALQTACDDAASGRFGPPLSAAPDAPDEDRILAQLLQCQRWLAGVDAQRPRFEDTAHSPELLMHHAEIAALELDATALTRLAPHVEASTARTPRDRTWLALTRCFLALARGETLDPEALVGLERAGRENKHAGQVLRAATLRALASEAAGHSEDAVEHARRAFRMARTERRPQAEYWAGWTLARQRRLTGRPYLASRILGALRRYAPAPWHRCIDLERTLAEGPDPASTPIGLGALVQHARTGDRAALDRTVDDLRPSLAAFAPLRDDVDDLLATLGLEVRTPRAAVENWRRGAMPFEPPPCGLSALAHAPLALVVGRPDQPGQRVLGLAEKLLPAEVSRALLNEKPGRTESLLAALTLVGPDGLPEDELFNIVYGFTYNANLHRGAWDVALHRTRSACGSLATLHRSDGTVQLEVLQPFVVPDPRCQRAHEDRVLQRMATSAGASARELATGLGISLRTVQDVLRDLVETGACQQHRDGRRRIYSVEDTTFQEPTRA